MQITDSFMVTVTVYQREVLILAVYSNIVHGPWSIDHGQNKFITQENVQKKSATIMKKFILFVSICFYVQIAYPQNNDSIFIKRLVDETMTNGTAYKNLKRLCKEAGQRMSGSKGFAKSVTLTAEMMKKIGVDTVYLQECMIPHWVRGEKEKGQINLKGNKKYDLHLCALGTSVATSPKGVTAPIVEVKSIAELNELGNTLKGKIVFFNFRMNPTYIRVFAAYGESGVSRTRGPSLAAKYGAVGVMVRSLAINFNDYPHTGTTRYNDSFPKIPAVAISTNDAEFLSKELRNKNVVNGYFKTSCQNLPDVKGYNVVGEIRGSEFPEEIITVGGHLDSWDLAEGASDDGTGVVQAIEVLRTIRNLGLRPKRTLRAVAFANEEISGTGAQKYLEQAKAKNEKMIFALESDAGGFTPRAFGFTSTPDQKAKIMEWEKLFRPYGVYEFAEGGGGSDIAPLKALGTVLCGFSPDSQRYFDIHHAATDVFENVSERELHLGAANMAGLIWLVSEHGM